MPDEGDENSVAAALRSIARALHQPGTADASTSKGGLEVLSVEVKEGSERIAVAIQNLADAVWTHSA